MVTPTLDELAMRPGQPVADLETPVLVVDLDAMERNVQTYVDFAAEHDVSLRSHVKTHKNADLANWQHEVSGGGGVVCQTLGEAEVMAKNGIDDIYLSYQVVGDRKLERLAWLAGKVDTFATTVDGEANIDPLQRVAAEHELTVDVILEIDLGLNRTGVAPGDPAVALAKRIRDAPNLSFAGVLGYEAHVKGQASTEAEYEQYCREAMDDLEEAVADIEDAGIPVEEVKVGGTATSKFSGKHPVVTEINPGMYPFNDVGELEHRPFEMTKDDCAATVLTTVISKPAPDRAVVDGGSKTFSLDKSQMPLAANRDDLTYANASEEHGWIESDGPLDVEVGDTLEFIVPHVCTTINLHDRFVGVRDGVVEDVFEVQARGKVR